MLKFLKNKDYLYAYINIRNKYIKFTHCLFVKHVMFAVENS